jgi:hypothetical protein
VEQKEPSRAQVVKWLEAVQHDLDRLHDRLAPLLEQQRRLEARQTLLKELLSSFGAPSNGRGEENGGASWAVSVPPPGSIGEHVRTRAEEILREKGGALHINALHEEFQRRGFHVPGAGRPVNLTVHLRKASSIVSPARGMYALEEYAGTTTAQPKATRRTRKRKKRRRTQRTAKREV